MIDFHNHILPELDDGSGSVLESMALLEEEMAQGVKHVVFTPHFYAHHSSIDGFLKRRDISLEKLKEAVRVRDAHGKLSDMLRVDVGAEVYYFSGIGRASMITRLCIQGREILLLEMPFCQWEKAMYEDIRYLIEKRSLTIILAHIERYYALQKDKSIWREVFELPLHGQINAGSLVKWEKRRLCLELLKRDHRIVLGSDCHNMHTRRPNLKAGRDVIEKKLGCARLDEMDALSERILP